MGRKKLTEAEKLEKEKEYQHKYYLKKTKEKRAKIKSELEASHSMLNELLKSGKLEITELSEADKDKIKICEICGEVFVPKNKKQKYCSTECKKEAVKQQEKIKMQNPLYVNKCKERRKKYRKSDKYIATRKKYSKTEKFKEALRRYRESEQGKAKIKEISKKAYTKYYAKKRELEAKSICPICKKEFIRNINHRLYCSEECKEIAKAKLLETKKELKREANSTVKVCPICQTKFKSYNKNEKYCSEACKELALKLQARIKYMKKKQ